MKMKIKKSITALTLTALLGLTACATEPGPAEAPDVAAAAESEPSPTATESTTPAPDEAKKSKRGNLIKEIGQGAGTFNIDTKDQLATFVVNAIEVDPVCTNPYAAEYPSENGHFIALDVSIETFPELAEAPYANFDLNPNNMKIIAPNGTTSNADLASMASYGCLDDAEELPSNGLGPAEKATGKIVIDSEVASGILVITEGGSTGWEYVFGGATPNA